MRHYPLPVKPLSVALALLAVSTPALSDGIHLDIPTLERVQVEGEVETLHSVGSATSSQGVIFPKRILNQTPARSSDVLEAVPGLALTQHSGGGKANQYFLRGFSLDHGTDLAVSLMGTPLNLPGHAHGQGYADTNLLIPELIARIEYRKGPYFAGDGDFATAGALNVDYFDELDQGLFSVTLGEDGFRRMLLADTLKLKEGRASLLLAVEGSQNDGPWQVPEDYDKTNVVVLYREQLDANRQLRLGFTSHQANWTATDHIPLEAVQLGEVDRFGSLDPTAGGETHRHALHGSFLLSRDSSLTQLSAYVIDTGLDLYSDFTYGLRDNSLLGQPGRLSDQFNQLEERLIYGGALQHVVYNNLPGMDSRLVAGVDIRRDEVNPVALFDTIDRQRLATRNRDEFDLTQIGLHLTQVIAPTDWLQLTAGLRHSRATVDLQGEFDDDEDLSTPNVARSGSRDDQITSPKLTATFGPFGGKASDTKLFLAAGQGFHSNDPRGLFTPTPVDFLVKTQGVEIGAQTRALHPSLLLTATVFQAKSDSELVFVGDAGTTEPKSPSKRDGLELIATYEKNGLEVDAFYTTVRARFTGVAEDAIPNAIGRTGGLSVAQAFGPWKVGTRVRYLGSAPLVEDGSLRSDVSVNTDVFATYRVMPSLTLGLSVFNVFDRDNSDIQYAQEYFFRGQERFGKTFHPAPGRQVRLTATLRF